MARRGLRTKEARENWEEREGKETTPEGSKFLTYSPPFVSNNNELESESCPYNNTIVAYIQDLAYLACGGRVFGCAKYWQVGYP